MKEVCSGKWVKTIYYLLPKMKQLSVVITVLNEKDNIEPLLTQLHNALNGLDYEVILVDDGSTDGTQNEIKKHADEHVRLIELMRNYGQSTAMCAGIDYAEGEYIALLDGDLQNDPADIPFMLDKLIEEGWDVVAGERKNRQDGMILRKIPSRIANALIRKWTNVHIRDYGCTLKVFKSRIAKNLGLYGELHRFIPVLASLQGAKICQVAVHHHARVHGESKYGINRTFKVMSDLILMIFFQKYLRKPMHLFGGIGILTTMLASVILLYLLVLKIMGESIGDKPLVQLGAMLFIVGIFLVLMGILAELLIRIYYQTGNNKTYFVRSEFDGKDKN